MATYVLVHGAWHGGWCWNRVRRALGAPDGSVYAPSLTGLGERAHLATPAVGLDAHVEDVLSLLASEDLRDAILVGHSYAGVVITAVADRAPDRLARLVYLDAVVPRDGECLFDRAPREFRAQVEAQVRSQGAGWLVPPPTVARLGLSRSEDVDWVMPKLVSHPFRTLHEPVRLRNAPGVPRSYINCIGGRPRGGARTAQAEGIDDYYELSTGHDAMVTAAEEVARLLRDIAQ